MNIVFEENRDSYRLDGLPYFEATQRAKRDVRKIKKENRRIEKEKAKQALDDLFLVDGGSGFKKLMAKIRSKKSMKPTYKNPIIEIIQVGVLMVGIIIALFGISSFLKAIISQEALNVIIIILLVIECFIRIKQLIK